MDLATGYGLADANLAVNATKNLTSDACCDNCASPSSQNFSTTSTNSLPKKVSKPMASEFPKLKKKLEQVQWKLNQELQKIIDDLDLEEDVELVLSESNFVSLSPINKSVNVLRGILDSCFAKENKTGTENETGKVKKKLVALDKVDDEHIYAAKGLLKLGKYSATAVDVLTQVIALSLDKETQKYLDLDLSKLDLDSTDLDKQKAEKQKAEKKKKELKDLKKLASQALSECRREINKMSSGLAQSPATIMMLTDDEGEVVGDNCFKSVDGTIVCTVEEE
jgi:ElaB/YqjD/DUF883 family membrane-anchored ribosome-binding protein